mgnify:CR=1 FL=1
MATPYANAVRAGTMAAARVHRDLDLRDAIEARGGNVDVFAAIQAVDLPLLLRPLQGLLGAYLNRPGHGVLITTQRPMSIQRFTAAHELGHFIMRHEPSLDDESILRRMPATSAPPGDLQEVEADAFASAFMLPRWLLGWHASRQAWTVDSFRKPSAVYQLSLRIGASYEATCWTLARNQLLEAKQVRELLQTQPRELKAGLLSTYRPENYRGDVWLLTERDAGTRIDGSRNDLFVLRLKEHRIPGGMPDHRAIREGMLNAVGHFHTFRPMTIDLAGDPDADIRVLFMRASEPRADQPCGGLDNGGRMNLRVGAGVVDELGSEDGGLGGQGR